MFDFTSSMLDYKTGITIYMKYEGRYNSFTFNPSMLSLKVIQFNPELNDAVEYCNVLSPLIVDADFRILLLKQTH